MTDVERRIGSLERKKGALTEPRAILAYEDLSFRVGIDGPVGDIDFATEGEAAAAIVAEGYRAIRAGSKYPALFKGI